MGSLDGIFLSMEFLSVRRVLTLSVVLGGVFIAFKKLSVSDLLKILRSFSKSGISTEYATDRYLTVSHLSGKTN